MKPLLTLALVLGMVLAVCSTARAVTVHGRVTFVGTIGEHVSGENYHAQFRFRVSGSTCTGDNVEKERWILVLSGRMDGKYIHNMANLRNAYSTVTTAFLSGHRVQVDGVPGCGTSTAQTIQLWNSQIGIY